MLFGLDPFGSIWHKAELVFGLGWGLWHFFGGPGLQTLVASENQDGRLELFGTRRDPTVWHAWQTSPGGTWSAWVLFFTPPSNGWSDWTLLFTRTDRFKNLAIGTNSDGHLEVFAQTPAGAMWHAWQGQPFFTWSKGASKDGLSLATFMLERNSQAILQLFGTDSAGKVWRTSKHSFVGIWSDWILMFNPADHFRESTAGQDGSGHIQVFAVGLDSALWQTWEVGDSGGWVGWNLAINIIRVAVENFTPEDNADLLSGIEITRTIFASVGIRLLARSWSQISARDAGGYATLERLGC